MTDTARYVPDFLRRLRPCGVWLALGLALCASVGPTQQARAQNLIVDPYFANGVPANGYTDSLGNTYEINGATAATMDGVTGVLLAGNLNSYFQVDPVAGFNPNGVDYVFSFLAAAVNPDIQTSMNASFAPVSTATCEGCYNAIVSENLTSSGLTQYTLTGTSTAVAGAFSYLYVQNSGAGNVFVTGLDFEPEGAPAPVPGGGILSACAAMAALALHRMRGRTAA